MIALRNKLVWIIDERIQRIMATQITALIDDRISKNDTNPTVAAGKQIGIQGNDVSAFFPGHVPYHSPSMFWKAFFRMSCSLPRYQVRIVSEK